VRAEEAFVAVLALAAACFAFVVADEAAKPQTPTRKTTSTVTAGRVITMESYQK